MKGNQGSPFKTSPFPPPLFLVAGGKKRWWFLRKKPYLQKTKIFENHSPRIKRKGAEKILRTM